MNPRQVLLLLIDVYNADINKRKYFISTGYTNKCRELESAEILETLLDKKTNKSF